MGNVTGAFEKLSGDVADAFADLSRSIQDGVAGINSREDGDSDGDSDGDGSDGGGRGRCRRRGGGGGRNLLSPNFQHALFLVMDFLTAEECFRVLVLDRRLYAFLSTHAHTWRMLFRRLCVASGETARFDAEQELLAGAMFSVRREVKYLQQQILHYMQDQLRCVLGRVLCTRCPCVCAWVQLRLQLVGVGRGCVCVV